MQMKQTKRLFLSFLTLLLATMTYAQEVTGTVSDSFGPVIGATVMEKGTANGTVTDFDGNFGSDRLHYPAQGRPDGCYLYRQR